MIAGTATGDSPCEIASPTPASPGQVGDRRKRRLRSAMPVSTAAAAWSCRRRSPRTSASCSSSRWPQARTVVAQVPDRQGRDGRRLPDVDRRTSRASVRTTRTSGSSSKLRPRDAVRAALRRHRTRRRRSSASATSCYNRGGAPDGFAGTNDHWHQHNANGGLCFNEGGTVIGGEEQTREECAAARWDEARAHRHLDGARVGRARLRVQLGRVRRRVPRARRQDRRHRLGLKVASDQVAALGSAQPSGDQLAVAAGGSPSRRALRARRASRCPGPSRARAAPS